MTAQQDTGTMMRGTPKVRGYLAGDVDRAVFLYRQSARVTWLVGLDYGGARPAWTVGSRFFGRFYPNRCDLSPDGRLFLYFVQGKSQKKYQDKHQFWTAFCQPPDVKALLLLAHFDTWGGGGRFLPGRKAVVAPGMHPDFDLAGSYRVGGYDVVFRDHPYNDWTSGHGWTVDRYNDWGIGKAWSKTAGGFTVKRIVRHGRNIGEFSLHRYEVYDRRKGTLVFDGADEFHWMDVDNRGRLIGAAGSRVVIFPNLPAILRRRGIETDLEQKVRRAQRLKREPA
ncbi:hypothetical protein [Rhodobium gokarnense]|uniref:Uncharacterized protein n=1 Tax=Rhodobium gokarnense TaxID=364296 RepID=A0ABT3HCW6_9HYPH|nr:hypothetical protein [Rhodobium gokarnense]MCW2308247.1 hypothetical protein [Rhodobium gokarnense]